MVNKAKEKMEPPRRSLLEGLVFGGGGSENARVEEEREGSSEASGVQNQVFAEEPSKFTQSYYYCPGAHRHVSLSDSYQKDRKKKKIIALFSPLEDHLRKDNHRVDSSLQREVLDLVLRLSDNLSSPQNLHSSRMLGLGRIEMKYLFIACVHLCLQRRLGEGFMFELSLPTLVRCYSHLLISEGTLGRYLTIARTILREEDGHPDRDRGIDGRVNLLKEMIEKMADVVCAKANELGVVQGIDRARVVSKAARIIHLHRDVLAEWTVRRPLSQSAFSVLTLSLTLVLHPHTLPPLSTLLALIVSSIPHLRSLEYFPCTSSLRSWKARTVHLFRQHINHYQSILNDPHNGDNSIQIPLWAVMWIQAYQKDRVERTEDAWERDGSGDRGGEEEEEEEDYTITTLPSQSPQPPTLLSKRPPEPISICSDNTSSSNDIRLTDTEKEHFVIILKRMIKINSKENKKG